MHRLNFKLHDFVRVTWISKQAEDIWTPRMERITACFSALSISAVEHSLLPCTLLSCAPFEVFKLHQQCSEKGLIAQVLGDQFSESFKFLRTIYKTQSEHVLVVVGSNNYIIHFKQAWLNDDVKTVLELLGWPNCCAKFHAALYIETAYMDPIWQIGVNTVSSQASTNECVIKESWQTNSLLHCLKLLPSFHLPCSFECSMTKQFVNTLVDLAGKLGYIDEISWLKQILSWPMEWSALHGIAEIKTPMFKISTNTDATADKYVIRYNGPLYPDEGVEGIMFPYKTPLRLRFTESKSFKRGQQNPID